MSDGRRAWTDADRRELDELASKVIGAAYEVANVLGVGFLEKVYRRALVKELLLRGVQAEEEASVQVWYKGENVGEYRVDVLVEAKLIVELKCAECFAPEHLAQCLNYLRATGNHLALLLNFQHPRVEWKRVVHSF